MTTKIVAKSNQEVYAPSRADVAAASRPKKAILAGAKQRKNEKEGKVHKLTKKESEPPKNINWKSPTYWPLIDQTAKEQVGKPNISELLRQLRRKDGCFIHLRQQRLSEWRDQSDKEKIKWSKKTLDEVQKGFLPGGIETRFNIFVSLLKLQSTSC